MAWVKVLRDMIITLVGPSVANAMWLNMPAVLTEFTAGAPSIRYRTKVDLTNYKQARLIVNVLVAGFAGSSLRVQYSLNEVAWFYLDGATGPECDIDALGVEESLWITLVAGARDDVYLRLVGINGDGVVDPSFGSITLQVK